MMKINCLQKIRILVYIAGAFLLFLTVMLPVCATSKTGNCGENLRWTLKDNTLTISGHGDMTDYADGALAPWIGLAGEIHAINLSAGMTSIGDYAFYNCKNVTTISIPPNIVEIGECAFAKCHTLSEIKFSKGLKRIDDGAFQECEELVVSEFPETLTEIGEKAFFKCSSIKEFTVSENVTVLGISAFSYCTGLKKAVINADITELPGWTFYGCTSLSEVFLAPQIVTIGDNAYLFCDNLKDTSVVEYNQEIIQESGLTPIQEQSQEPVEKDEIVYVPYDANSVDIPQSDLEKTDSNPDTSNLTDAEGTTYYISSRSSKWGITLKQFSVYVALWIASAVLIVAVIMLTMNQKKKSKEQYEELVRQGEAEDAAAEEELQLQIIKEMLNKK